MSNTSAMTRGFMLGPATRTTAFVDETPGGLTGVQASASIRRAHHPEGHELELAYLEAPNGERWVQCQEVDSHVRLLDSVEYRLRLTIQTLDGHDWCELRQARATGERWSSLFKPSFAELDEGAGMDVVRELRAAGALQVGTREAVLGDTCRRRSFPCVLFERGDEEIPVLAFVLTRVLPLLP